MNEDNNTSWESDILGAPQESPQNKEKKAIVEALEEVSKHIREGSSAATTVAAITILMGAVILIAFDLAPDTLGVFAADSLAGVIYVFFGLMYLALAVGIYKRSRICAFLAMAAFAADTIYMLVSGDFIEVINPVFIVVRIAIFLALFHGLRYCLKFRKLVREHEDNEDEEITEIIQARPKMTAVRRMVYVLIALIGIGTGVIGIMAGGTPDFEEWGTHREGSITMRIPSDNVQVEEEALVDLPGAYLISAISSTRRVETVIMRSYGFDQFPVSAVEEMAYFFLHHLTDELTNSPVISSGRMHGVRYDSSTGVYHDGGYFELRSLVVNNEMYIVIIVVYRDSDLDLIPKFFDSLVIRR